MRLYRGVEHGFLSLGRYSHLNEGSGVAMNRAWNPFVHQCVHERVASSCSGLQRSCYTIQKRVTEG